MPPLQTSSRRTFTKSGPRSISGLPWVIRTKATGRTDDAMHVNKFARSVREDGSTLALVLVLGTASLLILVGILSWSHSNSNFSGRYNQYASIQDAAEAATEKVIAQVGNDYQNFGVPLVVANLESYRAIVPTTAESSYWANYEFTDENGLPNKVSVDWFPLSESPVLSSKYKGLRGFAYDLRVVAKAREVNSPYHIV